MADSSACHWSRVRIPAYPEHRALRRQAQTLRHSGHLESEQLVILLSVLGFGWQQAGETAPCEATVAALTTFVAQETRQSPPLIAAAINQYVSLGLLQGLRLMASDD